MRVLVTGGGGFLGRYIVQGLLQRGDRVKSLGRSPQPDLRAQGVEVCQGELQCFADVLAACQGVDAICHVAAKAGVWGRWQDFYQTNVLGTRHVLAAGQQQGVNHIVYTSTPSVVCTGQSFTGQDESLPYGRRWLCAYAQTKAMAEQLVLQSHSQRGLQTMALRPHLIWGREDPHLVPRIVARARQGRLCIVGDGQNRVDITHVRNAADAHLLALDALAAGRAGGQAYFISQGAPVVLWSWINELLQRLGIPPVERRMPLGLAYGLGGVLELGYRALRLAGEPRMTRFVAVELAKSHYFDITAARRDLGYSPRISTEAGLEELVASWAS